MGQNEMLTIKNEQISLLTSQLNRLSEIVKEELQITLVQLHSDSVFTAKQSIKRLLSIVEEFSTKQTTLK